LGNSGSDRRTVKLTRLTRTELGGADGLLPSAACRSNWHPSDIVLKKVRQQIGCGPEQALADWSWPPPPESMRMPDHHETDLSLVAKAPKLFAQERASRRRKIINMVVVVGMAVDLFFAILYSVLWGHPTSRCR
jgi:hypothetical protein